MFDNTQLKIISATMELVMEKGYSLTTTKEIAAKAGVNECTIFRRFSEKKEIVLSAMKLPEWNPSLVIEDFEYCWNLEKDLLSFATIYMKKVTPKMVRVSIGLRTPELYPYTSEGILEVPKVFKKIVLEYFIEMKNRGLLKGSDLESLAMMFLSMNFGFVFLEASFGGTLTNLEKKQYIEHSVKAFVNGIKK